MKRLADFLKSVIPKDPAQLLFLAGTVCLVIAPRLNWRLPGFESTLHHDWLNTQLIALRGFLFFVALASGIAGYFVAFWPGSHPVRRIIWFIYLPMVPLVAIICASFVGGVQPYHSVFDSSAPRIHWSALALLRLPGPQFCLAGLLLIGIFTWRLIVRRSSLPLSLPPASLERHDHPEIWRRTQILIFVVMGPMFLMNIVMFASLMFSANFPHSNLDSVPDLPGAAEMLLVVGVASFIFGRRSAVPMLRRALSLPGEKMFLLAVVFSIGIPVLIAASQYLADRARWARGESSVFAPELTAYFHFHLPQGWMLFVFFTALFEEIVFRGFLQPRLTQRYGLHRGIFLVGIVWAASHFPHDFSFSRLDDLGVVHALLSRLCMGIVVSFVLGWLTLETGSVLAAALAHTFYNVLISSDLGPPFPGKQWLRLALWAALAWLLFRYRPVRRNLLLDAESILPAPSASPPSPAPENP